MEYLSSGVNFFVLPMGFFLIICEVKWMRNKNVSF